jgi:hypothetical protein
MLYDVHRTRTARPAEEERRQSEWGRIEQRISEVQKALTALRAQAKGAAEEAATARAGLDEQLAAARTPLLR